MKEIKFEQLKNKTLTKIIGGVGDEEMIFYTSDGDIYRLVYHRDCCAKCSVEDICGDLEDLIGHPIIVSEEVHDTNEPPAEGSDSSYTWVFYKLDTVKGGVTIRWFGSSNGCYSEEATFEKFINNEWETIEEE